MKTKRKYWIRFTWSECAYCGKPDNSRERVYGRKPRDGAKRHTQGRQWACDSHFM